jgi:hypothetical protein
VHTSDGVLILAAASNDGGNAAVMWPASESDYVICVNSSDGEGNPSSFNPTQPEGKPGLCTLGEGLELRLTPGQLVAANHNSSPGTKSARGHRVEKGTSFATPVAAALVATILGFVEKSAGTANLSEKERYRLRRTLRTAGGMRNILTQRCVVTSLAIRSGYHYVAPWFFSLEPTELRGIVESLGRRA